MTTFPGSPKLLKGAVIGIDLFNPISSVTAFQYNPERLVREIEPRYSETGNSQTRAPRLAGAPVETISAEIVIDLTDQMERGKAGALKAGIAAELAALEMLVYPKTSLVIANHALLAAGTMEVLPAAAPLTLFVYGWTRVVPVKMTGISIAETLHDRRLSPIRAEVSLSMQVLSYDDLPLTSPGHWAFLAHQTVKETLATVAQAREIGAALGEAFTVEAPENIGSTLAEGGGNG